MNLNKSSVEKIEKRAGVFAATLLLAASVPAAIKGVGTTNVHADASADAIEKAGEKLDPNNDAGIAEERSHFHMNVHPFTNKQASKYGDEWSPSKKDMEEMNKQVGHNIFRGKYWRDYIHNGYKHVNSHARRHHSSYRTRKNVKRHSKKQMKEYHYYKRALGNEYKKIIKSQKSVARRANKISHNRRNKKRRAFIMKNNKIVRNCWNLYNMAEKRVNNFDF